MILSRPSRLASTGRRAPSSSSPGAATAPGFVVQSASPESSLGRAGHFLNEQEIWRLFALLTTHSF
jgi:hypothetical protein